MTYPQYMLITLLKETTMKIVNLNILSVIQVILILIKLVKIKKIFYYINLIVYQNYVDTKIVAPIIVIN